MCQPQCSVPFSYIEFPRMLFEMRKGCKYPTVERKSRAGCNGNSSSCFHWWHQEHYHTWSTDEHQCSSIQRACSLFYFMNKSERSHSLCLFPGVSFLGCPLQSHHRHGNHLRWRQPPKLSAIVNGEWKRVRVEALGDEVRYRERETCDRRHKQMRKYGVHLLSPMVFVTVIYGNGERLIIKIS